MSPAFVEGVGQVSDDAGDEIGLDRVGSPRSAGMRPGRQQAIDGGEGEAQIEVGQERAARPGLVITTSSVGRVS